MLFNTKYENFHHTKITRYTVASTHTHTQSHHPIMIASTHTHTMASVLTVSGACLLATNSSSTPNTPSLGSGGSSSLWVEKGGVSLRLCVWGGGRTQLVRWSHTSHWENGLPTAGTKWHIKCWILPFLLEPPYLDIVHSNLSGAHQEVVQSVSNTWTEEVTLDRLFKGGYKMYLSKQTHFTKVGYNNSLNDNNLRTVRPI